MARVSKFEIVLHPAELAELERNPSGPVGYRILAEAGRVVARGARIRAPIRTGHLYDSIGWERGVDAQGQFVKVYAEWYDVFLEKPARQMHRARRTLRNAMHDVPRIIGG
jgi:Bacteriophage HK97-gp10, putative tail-component